MVDSWLAEHVASVSLSKERAYLIFSVVSDCGQQGALVAPCYSMVSLVGNTTGDYGSSSETGQAPV